jgi:hypothetical protein
MPLVEPVTNAALPANMMPGTLLLVLGPLAAPRVARDILEGSVLNSNQFQQHLRLDADGACLVYEITHG